MSLERRLRDELQHEADAIQPDVARHLGAVEAGARRRGGVGVPTLLIAAAIVVAAIILRLPGRACEPGRRSRPRDLEFGQPDCQPVGGLRRLRADRRDLPCNPRSDEPDSEKGWSRGVLDGAARSFRRGPTSPPVTFTEGANGLSGVAFSLTADRFRTDLFYNDHCSSVGTYQSSLAAGD